MGKSVTTYAAKWKHTPTQVIRVPSVMADRLIAIAHEWDRALSDEPQIFECREPVAEYQLPLPTIPVIDPKRAVNVSSIPQLSPFRYPGGKTWLVPTIRAWLRATQPKRLFEPFAGGAIVSLTSVAENLVDEAVFCELDPAVAAVWKTTLSEDCEWLVDQILAFEVNETQVKATLALTANSTRELAFQTIVRNRVQRGGIMAPGAGLVKAGENGKGLSSRWYPETLARRLRLIYALRDRLQFVQSDCFKEFRKYANAASTAAYIDPPYVKAARRLYSCWEVDHAAIFSLCAKHRADPLLSYDNTSEVEQWSAKNGFAMRPISMKNTHHATMDELLIGRDLNWFDKGSSAVV